MKKKTVLCFAVLVALTATYLSSEKVQEKSNSFEQLVIDNVEALSASSENSSGFYTVTSGRCAYPCAKSWTYCEFNGNEDCLPSDCC